MCGIAGILKYNNSRAGKEAIHLMTDAIAHRGPDSDGFYYGEELAFGHRRLAIIDLSSAANQPFTDNSGRYVMVFNGEMYNYQEVRSAIPDYTFQTNSDTEVLLAAYIKWGPGCISRFRGMFTFAIWDQLEKELFVARDRMGVKPLYFYSDDQQFIFASETRAILASGLVKRTINQAALREYFSFQSVSYPYSLIKDIVQLEAGAWMKIKNGHIEKRVYWDVTDSAVEFDFSDIGLVQQHIRKLMLQSVERRLVSDVPVGAFLSGGIDSSAIVGLMAEAGGGRPNTFNIAFEEKAFDESNYADIVAKKFGSDHHRILLKPSVFLDELQNALNAMDTATGDGINTYVVSKAIRQQGITVALSGVGGDELFAGYPFFMQYLQMQKCRWLWNFPGSVRKAVAGGLMMGGLSGKANRILQLLKADSPAIENAYPVFRQILSPELISSLVSLNGSASAYTAVQQELKRKAAHLQSLPLLSQVSASELLGYTQHTLLKDTDQMSMAVSLEVREPFFDQDLVEFMLAVPDQIKTPVYAKSLLVESLKPMLPDEVVFRKKQGFLFPWNIWLRNELREFCDMHICSIARKPIVHGDQLIKYWQRFLAGDKNVRWSEIWLFVVLEYWMERNNVTC
jgi:asparagine synthase (glutamine-hydrolysing)